MKCIYCQGEMRRGSAPFHVDPKGYQLLLDAVPAWVCSQCGEPYFEEPEVDSRGDPSARYASDEAGELCVVVLESPKQAHKPMDGDRATRYARSPACHRGA
jgi:YgiT-type zinc finger domain-containing protein